MEAGLILVNSDLIDLVESQLLGTGLNVNDDEDITMADDLLDLELDTMILSQSTCSNVVFRVPYKTMHDSQTSNSRLSSELCCKDQTRSNNNSALSDTTRSLTYKGMPPLEMVWDTKLTSATLPKILINQSSWVTRDTETMIQQYRGDKYCTTCRLCQQHFTTPRRLRVHVSQHFITTFCPCGEYSYHREYILRHQRTMECHPRYLYDVDELSFPTFLGLIKPLISDPVRYERLFHGFPAPRAVTQGPITKPPGYKKPTSPPPPRPHRPSSPDQGQSGPPADRSPQQKALALTRLSPVFTETTLAVFFTQPTLLHCQKSERSRTKDPRAGDPANSAPDLSCCQ